MLILCMLCTPSTMLHCNELSAFLLNPTVSKSNETFLAAIPVKSTVFHHFMLQNNDRCPSQLEKICLKLLYTRKPCSSRKAALSCKAWLRRIRRAYISKLAIVACQKDGLEECSRRTWVHDQTHLLTQIPVKIS
jgi:hypothetical protein